MSLAQITEKIRNDGQREAEEILAKAKAQADVVLQRAKEDCDALKSAFASRFDAERPEIFRRREIVANLDAGKMMLSSRRNLINDVYKAALDKMSTMEQAQYIALCESLLKGAVTTKNEELIVSSGEKFLNNTWLSEYNAKNGTELSFAKESADIAGGFILRRGKVQVNCSWDMLLRVAQEKQESDVVKRLFKQAE